MKREVLRLTIAVFTILALTSGTLHRSSTLENDFERMPASVPEDDLRAHVPADRGGVAGMLGVEVLDGDDVVAGPSTRVPVELDERESHLRGEPVMRPRDGAAGVDGDDLKDAAKLGDAADDLKEGSRLRRWAAGAGTAIVSALMIFPEFVFGAFGTNDGTNKRTIRERMRHGAREGWAGIRGAGESLWVSLAKLKGPVLWAAAIAATAYIGKKGYDYYKERKERENAEVDAEFAQRFARLEQPAFANAGYMQMTQADPGFGMIAENDVLNYGANMGEIDPSLLEQQALELDQMLASYGVSLAVDPQSGEPVLLDPNGAELDMEQMDQLVRQMESEVLPAN